MWFGAPTEFRARPVLLMRCACRAASVCRVPVKALHETRQVAEDRLTQLSQLSQSPKQMPHEGIHRLARVSPRGRRLPLRPLPQSPALLTRCTRSKLGVQPLSPLRQLFSAPGIALFSALDVWSFYQALFE